MNRKYAQFQLFEHNLSIVEHANGPLFWMADKQYLYVRGT